MFFPMSDFSFNLVYDGEDLEAGSIDARDLAPALLAFADLVDQSGRLVAPEMPRVTVRVKTGFRKGSFDVALQLADAYAKFVTLFGGNHVQAWETLFGVLGISKPGLFQLIKRAKGRKPRVIEIERSEKVKITFDGEEAEVEEIPAQVWELFNHSPTRRAIERVIEPVTKDGIDEMEIRGKGNSVVHISKQDAPFFKAPTDNENENVIDIPNTMLVILSPSFREGNKWKVSGGMGPIWVTIEDESFIARVNAGSEAFRKGDILHVTLRTRQWMEGKDIKAEHSILEVHQHVNRLDHPDLPGTENA